MKTPKNKLYIVENPKYDISTLETPGLGRPERLKVETSDGWLLEVGMSVWLKRQSGHWVLAQVVAIESTGLIKIRGGLYYNQHELFFMHPQTGTRAGPGAEILGS